MGVRRQRSNWAKAWKSIWDHNWAKQLRQKLSSWLGIPIGTRQTDPTSPTIIIHLILWESDGQQEGHELNARPMHSSGSFLAQDRTQWWNAVRLAISHEPKQQFKWDQRTRPIGWLTTTAWFIHDYGQRGAKTIPSHPLHTQPPHFVLLR